MSTDTGRPVVARLRPWLIRLVSVALLLVVWDAAAGRYGAYLMGTPTGVWESLVEMTVDGTLVAGAIATGRIMMSGLLLSIVVGVPVGIAQGTKELFDWVANPFVTVFYILPPAGFVPLFIIWFGIGTFSKILLTFVFGVIPVVINVREGVKNTEDEYFEVGSSFGASRRQTFRFILLPGTIPYIVTGIRHAIARTIIGAIVAEIFLSAVGIGGIILESTSLFNITQTIAVLIVLALASLVLTLSVSYAERLLFPWRAEDV
jgi:NitT/TauT family transport system permease protein